MRYQDDLLKRVAIMCAGLAVLSACRRESRQSSTQVAAVSTPHCGSRVRGAAELFGRGHTILLGDVHGSQEIPRAVSDIACEAAESGLPLELGLEVPAAEDDSIERFLASSGTAAERNALLSSPFWATPPAESDGRGSIAMFELVNQMRQLRYSGHSVVIFGMIQPANNYDLGMALTVERRRAADAGALMILFAGGNHTRLDDGFPTGAQLLRMGIPVTSLRVVYANGTTWSCEGVCREARIDDGDDLGTERFVLLHHERDLPSAQLSADRRTDGMFYVGALHSSAPAAAALTGGLQQR
jgi:hypothetical protein